MQNNRELRFKNEYVKSLHLKKRIETTYVQFICPSLNLKKTNYNL